MQKSFLKVIIIGDSGVGKTSLLEAFNYQKIQKNSKPTIGAEFTKKKITLGDYPDRKEVNLQLWDTAGQERFQSLCTSFYRGSDQTFIFHFYLNNCCMLVFDVSQIETYESLDNWREVFQQTTGDQTQEIPIILIGNKSDKPKAINTDVVESDWVQTGKAKAYIETSALKVLGVDNIFNSVAYHALEYLEQQRVSNQQMINIKNMRQSFSENSSSTRSTNNRIKMTRSKERQIINKKQQFKFYFILKSNQIKIMFINIEMIRNLIKWQFLFSFQNIFNNNADADQNNCQKNQIILRLMNQIMAQLVDQFLNSIQKYDLNQDQHI